MKDKKTDRTLDLRMEKQIMKVMDFFSCLGIALLTFFLWKSAPEVDTRLIFVLCLAESALVMWFMLQLEEYTPTISTFQERVISIILSCTLSWLISSVIALLFIRSWLLFGVHTTQWILLGIVMLALNYAFDRLEMNERYFKKQKMLVIADPENNFARMKRVKYGIQAHYDSWYESMNFDDPEAIDKFMDEHLDEYDAICIFDNIRNEAYEQIVQRALLMNKDVYAVPKIIDINRNQAANVRFDDVLVFYIQKYALHSIDFFFKRIMDIVLSVIAIILTIIPMGVIAALIYADDHGPVFYRQERYTRNKKIFKIIKFRTMIVDAEKYSGPKFAELDDPRITKIGRVLRSYRLDELPQLFNILIGDMSFVGPRPERPFFVEQFEKKICNYDYRFVVKAGLTSLSHIYGRYSTYIHDRTCYDLLYISNYSVLLDLKIMLMTAKTMFVSNAADGEDQYTDQSQST